VLNKKSTPYQNFAGIGVPKFFSLEDIIHFLSSAVKQIVVASKKSAAGEGY
jgi:hypothetical protein